MRHCTGNAAVRDRGECRKPAKHVLAAAEHTAAGGALEVLRVHEEPAAVIFGGGRPLLDVDAADSFVR